MLQRDARAVEKALRAKTVVAIMIKAHAHGPEDVINTVKTIHEFGYVPEVTYRIDQGIIREAMTDINAMRDHYTDDPLLVGIGSVTTHDEMAQAIDMGFDMVVSPDNAFEGYGKKIDFAKVAREANVFSAPGAMTPAEFRYFLEGEDGITPDAIKIFPASVYGPEGLGRMLDPYDRDSHQGIIVIPTGGVTADNGPLYQRHIGARGFDTALAMSDPLSLVIQEGKIGDLDTIRRSLEQFRQAFKPYTIG